MAILHMAELPHGEWATAKDMATRYAIPPELLGKVLQALARGSLVVSMPGVRGGYRLEKALGELTLGTVIEAVDGPVALVDCHEGPMRCAQFDTCIIKEPVQQIRTQLIQFIHNISLNQFRTTPVLEATK